jgi:hypothetical protein
MNKFLRSLATLLFSVLPLVLIAATLIFLTSSRAQALNISGYIIVDDGQYMIVERETSRTYKILPSNPDVRKSLLQLTTFDAIRGQISNKTSETLVLETIDFVSLRRLLGDWTDETARVSFVDFARVSFDMSGNARHFYYALSPSQNNTYRIYLTDQSSVVLGSLNIEGFRTILEFYDSATGRVAQRLELSKAPPRLAP